MYRSAAARSLRHSLAAPLLLAAFVLPGLPRASHAAPARAALRTYTISAAHISFPTRITAGMVALRVVSGARGPLEAGVARINPGSSMAEIGAANASGDFMRLTKLVTFLGGVGVPARSTGIAVIDLRTPGRYGVHVQSGDQGPGTALFVTVTPAVGQNAALPRADVSVSLQGTRFAGLPSTLRAGTTTFKITNSSTGVRDMLIFRVDGGKTVRDMIAAENIDAKTGKDPAWLHNAASMDVLSPRQSARVTVHLVPGNYFALCPLPDPLHGDTALALEGMLVPLTVVS